MRKLVQGRRRNRAAVASLIALAALVAIAVSIFPGSAAKSAAQDTSSYTVSTVLLGPAQVIGGIYEPTSTTANESIALVLTHENNDFIGSIPCVQMAQRGFTVLCVKSQYAEHALARIDDLAIDVGAAVTYLRGLPQVKHVVLAGWSGGGGVETYYQNVAENGLAACQDPARLDPCGDNLAGLPPADGVVLLDSTPGIAFDRLSALDGSVMNETNPGARNQSLDMFSLANGYNTTASSDYSTSFIDRYTRAQGERMSRIISRARTLQQQVAQGTAPYSDDVPMPTGRDSAEIWQADSQLLSHTKGEYPVISPGHPNGGVPQVVDSVRVPSASSAANGSWSGGGNDFTANSFMASSAILAPDFHLTADSITGVDWASSNTATVNNVRGITRPLLIMSMTGHYFLVPSEMYYDNATRTSDKTLVFVEGATHGFTPCTACATTPGEFGDTVAETFNYVSNWLTQRFGN
jgi:hypothetical protein